MVWPPALTWSSRPRRWLPRRTVRQPLLWVQRSIATEHEISSGVSRSGSLYQSAKHARACIRGRPQSEGAAIFDQSAAKGGSHP